INPTTPSISTHSLHDSLPILLEGPFCCKPADGCGAAATGAFAAGEGAGTGASMIAAIAGGVLVAGFTGRCFGWRGSGSGFAIARSEEHTSELQSRVDIV